MSWDRVWTLALVQFGAEDIEIRILVGLGMAFLVLMIVEGMRASFRVRTPKPFSMPQPPAAQRSFAPTPGAILQPLRARNIAVRAVPKPARLAACRHQPVKPKIHRRHAVACKPNSTEAAAPNGPLPPHL